MGNEIKEETVVYRGYSDVADKCLEFVKALQDADDLGRDSVWYGRLIVMLNAVKTIKTDHDFSPTDAIAFISFEHLKGVVKNSDSPEMENIIQNYTRSSDKESQDQFFLTVYMILPTVMSAVECNVVAAMNKNNE
ncbi:MAG: hypothetical protein HAW67_04880 [Endozoicomonadaceae bacterium]|nr:hypothetical protein [Endozoicomonadaceae bacterium]